ncbi:serine/threonine-protein kinase [Stieleria varia]|uniref:Serine/threonine-protein kinase PrkC n=1 Tax=Stieleria varia TaxID=2528005 RepID=A0A5C6BAM0_9BACT|nr:serine/threonine-protein kinase [Stieleria varia]TWU08329.1 Serine/threonine-protein kinase PrkC [Stieleria varia]
MPPIQPTDESSAEESASQRWCDADSGSFSSSSADGLRNPVESLASQWLQRVRQSESDPRANHLDVATANGPTPTGSSDDDTADVAAKQLSDLLPVLKRLESARRQNAQRPSGLASLGSKRPERLGDFRIIRQIGRGGMGVVFEAEQISLGRTVAIKVLPQSMLQEDKQVQRFHVEAQFAASLHHTNIVPVFGFGEDAGYHFYVMQRINGQGLDRVRLSGSPLDVDLVIKIGKQAASALHYAHRQGVLHRDVKPANLLLDQDDNLWITDFGVAKAIESVGQTRTNDVVGTLRYMAPEHFLGSANPRSDVYSLGCTLYELLAGHPAFDDESIRAALVRRMPVEAAAPIRKINRSVPRDLETILNKAMAADESDRYQDAGELADDLERLANGDPIHARRHSPLELTLRFAKRKPAVAALTALSTLLLAAIALTSTWGYLRNQSLLSDAVASRAAARSTATVATDALDQLFARFAGDDLLSDIMRSSNGEISSSSAITPAVSPETAAILQDLLGYYDRIAKMQSFDSVVQATEDVDELDLHTMQSAATAKFHIGSIHWRLGRYYAAANAFKLSLADHRMLDRASGQSSTVESVVRQVGLLNRIALALYQLSDHEDADQYIERALNLIDQSPADIAKTPACRFAKARSHYLLGFHLRPGMTADSMPSAIMVNSIAAGRDRLAPPGRPGFNSPPRRRPPPDKFGDLFDPGFDPESLFDRASDVTSADPERKSPGGNLMARADAAEHLATATEILRRLVDEYPDRPAYSLQLAITLREQAVDVLMPESSEQSQAADQAIEILDVLQTQFPENTQIRWERIRTLADMNVFRVTDATKQQEGLKRIIQAAASLDALISRYPGIDAYQSQHAHMEFKRGTLLRLAAENDGRRRREDIDFQISLAFRNAAESMAAVVLRNPDARGFQAWHATFQMWLGDSLRRIGEGTEAVEQFRQANETWKSLAEKSDAPIIQLGMQHTDDALVDLLTEAF